MYHNYGSDLVDALVSNVTEADLVSIIKQSKQDLNKLDASNRTPLLHLVNECGEDYKPYEEKDYKVGGHVAKAAVLFNNGADPNVQDSCGWTVVHQCAAIGNLPMLQLCVLRGGNVNVINKNNQLPLDLAVMKKHRPIVEYLELQSCNIKCLCRHAIREAMGRRTYNRINELPLPSSLKLFVNYYVPFPGFSAAIAAPRPWSDEEILNGSIKHDDIRQFFEENASEDFNTNKQTHQIDQKTSMEELAAMMESLYFWESFKTIEYFDQPARPPRHSMVPVATKDGDDESDDENGRGSKPKSKFKFLSKIF